MFLITIFAAILIGMGVYRHHYWPEDAAAWAILEGLGFTTLSIGVAAEAIVAAIEKLRR